jgi:hypothetical protein
MSDASRHAMHFVAETAYGVTPNNPAFKGLRHTGTTVGAQRGSLQSAELRADRQIAHFRLGSIAVAGDASGELSFASYDDFLEAVTLGTWAPKATLAAITIAAVTASDTFTDSGSGFIVAGFQVGDLIEIAGFTTPGNNGTFLVASVAAGILGVTNPDGTAAAGITDEAAGDAVTITTLEDRVSSGVVRRSFTVLRNFTDIEATGDGEPFHIFKGVELNSLAITIDPNAIVGAVFGTNGREPDLGNAAPAGATFTAAPNTEPLDAFTGEIKLNGVAVGVISAVNFTLENGLEARPVVGSKFGLRPGVGRSNLTGQVTAYFEDSSLVRHFYDESDCELTIELPDGAGNVYVFEILRFKLTGAQPDISGQGSITIAAPFQAFMNATELNNFRIRRIPAVA